MQNLLRFSVIGLAMMLCTAAEVYALQEPRPIATDYRIRNIRFSPNEVFKFVGHYGYQSSIEFGEGEEIQTVSIGDSIAWQIDPSGDRLFLKPVEQDACCLRCAFVPYHYSIEWLGKSPPPWK